MKAIGDPQHYIINLASTCTSFIMVSDSDKRAWQSEEQEEDLIVFIVKLFVFQWLNHYTV